MFYQQLIALCEREGVKPTPLIKSLGFSAGNIKRWENGATVNSDILLAVSKHFKVSIDYLLTGNENQTTVLTIDEQELLNSYGKLNDVDKKEASARVEELATRNTYKEQRIEPTFSKSEISKMNTYENRLLSAFRELSYEEQIELTVRAETMVEKFKAEENVG